MVEYFCSQLIGLVVLKTEEYLLASVVEPGVDVSLIIEGVNEAVVSFG